MDWRPPAPPPRLRRTGSSVLPITFCFVIVVSLFLNPIFVFADAAVPALTARVTDLTATLNASQIQYLDQSLATLEREKGSQVAILIVPTTQPEAIEPYALRVVEAWKLGRKGVDDGALILVAKNDRAVRIEVGYGLEGALPDVIAKRIIDQIIVPAFRQGEFFSGLERAVEAVSKIIRGEPLPEVTSHASGDQFNDTFPVLIFGGIVAGLLLSNFIGRILAGLLAGMGAAFAASFFMPWIVGAVIGAIVFFITAILMNISRSGARGYYGGRGYSSSAWGSGGFSSGGFGGGGGSFGGGGASGRW